MHFTTKHLKKRRRSANGYNGTSGRRFASRFHCRLSRCCRIEYQIQETPDQDADSLLEHVAEALSDELPGWSMLTSNNEFSNTSEALQILLIGKRI